MGNIAKNHHSRFELNATRNGGTLGFFQRASPLTTTARGRLAAFGDQVNTAVKRYTHARDLRKARGKQRQIEYKGVKS